MIRVLKQFTLIYYSSGSPKAMNIDLVYIDRSSECSLSRVTKPCTFVFGS